jgi:hypothetical protein
MPNALAHLGIQGIVTRSWLAKANLKWIFIGCIIPDLPWILQRLIWICFPNIERYDLRLFAAIQSSLFFCLILSFALAAFAKRFWKVFIILFINSLLHLLLDALQTKFANGVQFFVPFSWKITNLELFWPESLPTYLLTALGLIYFILNWKKSISSQIEFIFRPIRLGLFLFFISVYFALPFFLLNGPEKADNHFARTLRSYSDRKGKDIELDRAFYLPKKNRNVLITFAGEEIEAEGIKPNQPALVSIRGSFSRTDCIRVSQFHVHSKYFRQIASYFGLGLVAMVWIIYFIKRQKEY